MRLQHLGNDIRNMYYSVASVARSMPLKKYDEADLLRLHIKHLDRRIRTLERMMEQVVQNVIAKPQIAQQSHSLATEALMQQQIQQLQQLQLQPQLHVCQEPVPVPAAQPSHVTPGIRELRQRTML
jgi:hypothetical protein